MIVTMRWQYVPMLPAVLVLSIFFVSTGLDMSTASAQTQAFSIAGVVTDRTSGEASIGTAVMIFLDTTSVASPLPVADALKHPIRGAITNKFGFFSLAKVPPGHYFLVIKALGYKRDTRRVTIADQSLRIDIHLDLEVKEKEIVVTGDREPKPTQRISSVDVKPEMLQHLPALSGETDIFRALQLLPGVKQSSEISSGLYVRGGSPDQNLNLLDGVIVYNPSHLAGFMSTFNSDAIQDIHLIKGAFPAEYGGRLSSVLDLTMKEGTKEKISGTAGVSMINSRLTVEGPLGENSTFMLSGRRMYLDLLLALAPKPDPNTITPDYYFYDLNGKINFKLGETDHLFVSGYFGRDVFSAPQDSLVSDIFWGNSTANIRWWHIMSPSLFTNFSAIYTDYVFNADLEDTHVGAPSDNNFKSVSGVRDYMLRGEAQYFPSDEHTMKFGLEATEHRFRADASASIGDFARIDQTPTIFNSIDAALYGQDEWKITPALSSNIGTRLYYFQDGGYFRVEPRVALAYNLTSDVQLTGAFSMGNQFLHLITRNDITLPTDVWFPSTKEIKPEQATQYVLGVQTHLFDNEYFFSVEGYYKSMKNLYEYKDTASFSLDVPLESAFTSGTGEAYGIEFFLNRQIGPFTGWLGYTLSWTSRLFPELNNGLPFYPRYDERHDIQAVFTYRIGETWEFGATWTYSTGQAYTMPTGQYGFSPDPQNSFNYQYGNNTEYSSRNGWRLPAFHKLDLNFTHSFSWFSLPWQVSINIYNAYNQKNVFAEYVERDYSNYNYSNTTVPPYSLHQITLFPIIPTFGLSCKF
ncbi:MAG: TonB-dependent receptor [Bacteroidota bacterium]|nr:TonB-dependent receptor [Bacteroidota bacterium]